MMTTNLPCGYNRDLQLLKEVLFPAIAELRSCIHMAVYMLENLQVKEHSGRSEIRLPVQCRSGQQHGAQRVPFREAYKSRDRHRKREF